MSKLIYKSPTHFKHLMSWWPPYWGTGISVRTLAPDFSAVTIQMKERFYNRNAFGTHFGGSLYAMCDPFYAILLIPQLGSDYLVWDQAAQIDFVKPGRGTVTAHFEWTSEEIADIRAHTAHGEKYMPSKSLEIRDEEGDVVARVVKTLYVRKRREARPPQAGL